MRNRLLSVLVFAAALMALPATAGSHKTLSAAQLDTRLKNYVLATRAKNVVYAVQPYMESYSVDDARRVLTLNVSTPDAFRPVFLPHILMYPWLSRYSPLAL